MIVIVYVRNPFFPYISINNFKTRRSDGRLKKKNRPDRLPRVVYAAGVRDFGDERAAIRRPDRPPAAVIDGGVKKRIAVVVVFSVWRYRGDRDRGYKDCCTAKDDRGPDDGLRQHDDGRPRARF